MWRSQIEHRLMISIRSRSMLLGNRWRMIVRMHDRLGSVIVRSWEASSPLTHKARIPLYSVPVKPSSYRLTYWIPSVLPELGAEQWPSASGRQARWSSCCGHIILRKFCSRCEVPHIYSNRYGSHLEPLPGAEAVTLKEVVSEQLRPVV